jgi:hypothetical protein
MKHSASSRFLVTVTDLPVVPCHICGQDMADRPGQASAVLTKQRCREVLGIPVLAAIWPNDVPGALSSRA